MNCWTQSKITNTPHCFYLLNICGESISDALSHLDYVMIHAGDVTSYVEELMEDMGALEGQPEQLRFYFDYNDSSEATTILTEGVCERPNAPV